MPRRGSSGSKASRSGSFGSFGSQRDGGRRPFHTASTPTRPSRAPEVKPPKTVNKTPAPAPAPAVAPTRKQEQKPTETASKAPPRPAPVHVGGGGGSMLGGLGESIIHGFGFRTGSEIASRTMDSVIGPRTVVHETPAPAVAAAAPDMSSMGSNVCPGPFTTFLECLNSNSSDISKCQFYMDMLTECKRNITDAMLNA